MIGIWPRGIGAIVGVALLAFACSAPGAPAPAAVAQASLSPPSDGPVSSPTPGERDRAIAVAAAEAAGNSATHPVLIEAHREVLNCTQRPCPEVWTVSFAVTDASGKRGQATVEIDAARGTLMYSDWSWR
jgi:hypothetical protein